MSDCIEKSFHWLIKNFISLLFLALAIYSVFWKAEGTPFPENTIWFGACIFCLCLTQLSRFKKIKGLGMEAELWDETQEKAEVLTKQLGSLANRVNKRNVIIMAKAGIYGGGFSRQQQWEAFQEVVQLKLPMEDTSKQFKLVVLNWFLQDWHLIFREPFRSYMYQLIQRKDKDPSEVKFIDDETEKVKSLNKYLNELTVDTDASSFEKEGNRIIAGMENYLASIDLESKELVSFLEKDLKEFKIKLETLRGFVQTGNFENKAWFTELLENDR